MLVFYKIEKFVVLLTLVSGVAFCGVKNIGVYDLETPSKNIKIFEHKKNQGRVFMLSTRNSGSHWAMYLIQFFTKQVWQVPAKKYAFFNSCIDDENNYIRCHESSNNYLFNEPEFYYFPYNKDEDQLIFLVRNLKEHIFKLHKNAIVKILGKSSDPKQQLYKFITEVSAPMKNKKGSFLTDFFQNIDTFLSWNKEQRVLIRFEDLILKPSCIIDLLNPFILHSSTEKVDSFLNNIDAYRKQCAMLVPRFNRTSREAHIRYGSSKKISSSCSFKQTQDFSRYSLLFDEIFEEYYSKYYFFLKSYGCL